MEKKAEEQVQVAFEKYLRTVETANPREAFIAGWQAAQQEGWIDVKDRLPEFIEGEDYSENVLALVAGYKYVQVMMYGYNSGYDEETNGHYWASCNGDISGEAEWDDNYKVTHWQPIPKPLPAPPQSIKQE